LSKPETKRPAFAAEGRVHSARAALKAAWWGATGAAARAVTRSRNGAAPASAPPRAAPPPRGFVRRAWREALDKDARDVAAGLYPPMERSGHPVRALRQAADLIGDARAVERRRAASGGVEARVDPPASRIYPAYYRQNFHFQSGGWFTLESARRYEAQVETLFGGAGGAMRRRALSLLAQAWRGRDHRGLAILDLACGSGAFLKDLALAFPRARLFGADLSAAYLGEAFRSGAGALLTQANAERLPFADASFDAVTCVYLFHELPPKIRFVVAGEIGRVLAPGGLLAFADAIQPNDEPRLERLLEVFPAYFHEPFFESYEKTDLAALFEGAGLALRDRDAAFLTKAMLLERVTRRAASPPRRVPSDRRRRAGE
jgi:ubiquinone/menaquinone biosynthesis C-methylase UbiE